MYVSLSRKPKEEEEEEEEVGCFFFICTITSQSNKPVVSALLPLARLLLLEQGRALLHFAPACGAEKEEEEEVTVQPRELLSIQLASSILDSIYTMLYSSSSTNWKIEM